MVELTRLTHLVILALYGLALLVDLGALAFRGRALERVALGLVVAGLGGQLLVLASRWAAGGYLPVTGLYSTLTLLAVFVVGIALYFRVRYRASKFLPGALALGLAAMAGASGGSMELAPLSPALDTPLFELHVVTSFAAYGLFGAACLVGVYRLLGIPGSESGQERRMLDESLYLGYVLFTWCMLAGSLWAYLAWGSYWTWRTKGLWSWIVWFYYSGVIHVRGRRGWQGWPLDVLSVAGFGLVLFTFLGLGLLFETSHPLR